MLARTHQSLIWDRQRKLLRLRAALREFFFAALATFPDLTAVDAVELLAAASDPAMAPGLSRARIAGALTRAWRRDVAATVAVISTFNAQIAILSGQVETHFGRHPDAEIIWPSPDSDRSLAPGCWHSDRARKNDAGTTTPNHPYV